MFFYELFLSLNISDFRLFFMLKLKPLLPFCRRLNTPKSVCVCVCVWVGGWVGGGGVAHYVYPPEGASHISQMTLTILSEVERCTHLN